MTVLVTGGAGYIGSHMVWTLLDAGERVCVLDDLSTGFDWAVPEGVSLIVGNVADRDLVGRALAEHGVEAVIHFAGSIVLPESVVDPLKYYRNNTCASRSLIEACVAGGVRSFIFSSTAAVYGEPETVPVAETALPRPSAPYGTSKLMTELMLRDTAAAHDFRYAALRYFNVAGADPETRTGQSTRGATNLVKVACEAAAGKRPYLSVYGTDYRTPDGTGVRDYIHVSDLVAAHYLALRRLRAGAESMTLNCGYGRGYSVLQVADAVRRVSGADFEIRTEPRRPGDLAEVVADATRIRAELDWMPRHDDLEAMVRHALAWEHRLAMRNSR